MHTPHYDIQTVLKYGYTHAYRFNTKTVKEAVVLMSHRNLIHPLKLLSITSGDVLYMCVCIYCVCACQCVCVIQMRWSCRVTNCHAGTRKSLRTPTLREIFSQKCGLYIAEFYWHKGKTQNEFHCVCVDCDLREVRCNTLGKVPFCYNRKNESARTHRSVHALFSVRHMVRCYILAKS